MTAFGHPGVHDATKALLAINNALSGIVQAVAANPEAAKIGLLAFASLAASLVVIGTAAVGLAVLGTGGVVAVVLGAIALFLTGLAAMNWGAIKNAATGIKEFFVGADEYVDEKGGFHARKKGIAEVIKGIIAEFLAKIASIPGMLAAGIQAMAAAIANKISAALAWVGSMLNFGGAGGGIQKQNFTPPPGGGKIIQTQTTLNVDGRRMAEALSYHQARSSYHVRAAANYDGLRSPTPVDYSFA